MNTSIAEETATAAATAAGKEPKATRKARVAPRRARVAPAKGKAGKKASPAKKAPKGATKAKGVKKGAKAKKPASARATKTSTILELLQRPGGVTAKELMKATGWLPHSVRGFISGTVGKKMGLIVTSVKGEEGERSYSVKA